MHVFLVLYDNLTKGDCLMQCHLISFGHTSPQHLTEMFQKRPSALILQGKMPDAQKMRGESTSDKIKIH